MGNETEVIEKTGTTSKLNGMLSWHYGNGFFWFRIFGRGLVATDRTKHRELFSVRNNIIKVWRIGKWTITAAPR